jgi:hypothetical protein
LPGVILADTDFYKLLARRIEESAGSGLTRQDIYAAARAALQKQAVLQRPYLSIEDIRRHLASLETAISHLEAGFAEADEARWGPRVETRSGPAGDGTAGLPERSEDASHVGSGLEADLGGSRERLRPADGGMGFKPRGDEAEVSPVDEPPEQGSDFDRPNRELIVPPARYLRHRDAAIYDIDLITPDTVSRQADPPPLPVAKRILASTAFLVQLTIASLAGVTIYAFLVGGGIPGVGFGAPPASTAVPAPTAPAPGREEAARPPAEGPASVRIADGQIALPTMFGVYAVRDGRLIELEPIATEPVDPRAKHLQQIVKRSRTVMPDGKVTFLVFRRELIVAAPERIPVKFAAKISRLMGFDPQGKVVWTQPAKDTWLIRDAGFDFRVMPVKESPEMVYVRAEDPAFALPAGRYVLMVNNQPYDFMIEGKVTDPGHCVEGSATMRGSVFYECKPS